jgi:hypothetical protein
MATSVDASTPTMSDVKAEATSSFTRDRVNGRGCRGYLAAVSVKLGLPLLGS